MTESNLSAQSVFELYDSTKDLVFETNDTDISSLFSLVEKDFESKRENLSSNIMMYGVYNAGKSTLINALLGKEVAETADVPLTSKINKYTWKNYTLYDTPGIDAPRDHEQITHEFLENIDGVIFVVNPSGAAEEKETLETLVDLLANKKQVFLVLNEKQELTDKNYMLLKNSIRERIQEIAEIRGLTQILSKVPILRINARRALQGFLKNSKPLIANSGFYDLEKSLTKFLSSLDEDTVATRLLHKLKIFLEQSLSLINSHNQSEIAQSYRELLSLIAQEHRQAKIGLEQSIERSKNSLYNGVKGVLRQNTENYKSAIEQLFNQEIDRLQESLQESARFIELKLQEHIADVEKLIIQKSHDQASALSNLVNSDSDGTELLEPLAEKKQQAFSLNTLETSIKTIQTFTKPEHIVEGLKVVKEIFPSLMKGIGPKTMEKWAGNLTARWIPYVGTAITVAQSLMSVFSEDPEEKMLKHEIAQRRRERERYEQQLEDNAITIAEAFESSAYDFIENNFDSWIDQVINDLQEKLSELTAEQIDWERKAQSFEKILLKIPKNVQTASF